MHQLPFQHALMILFISSLTLLLENDDTLTGSSKSRGGSWRGEREKERVRVSNIRKDSLREVKWRGQRRRGQELIEMEIEQAN